MFSILLQYLFFNVIPLLAAGYLVYFLKKEKRFLFTKILAYILISSFSILAIKNLIFSPSLIDRISLFKSSIHVDSSDIDIIKIIKLDMNATKIKKEYTINNPDSINAVSKILKLRRFALIERMTSGEEIWRIHLQNKESSESITYFLYLNPIGNFMALVKGDYIIGTYKNDSIAVFLFNLENEGN